MAEILYKTLFVLEPIAWFLATIPLFHVSLLQPTNARWKVLPLHIWFQLECFRKADRLALILPESVWFVALTAICAAVHHTSALTLECWTMNELRKASPGRSDTVVALKAWMNPQRSHLQRHSEGGPSFTKRTTFLARKLLELAAIGVVCIACENLILATLNPEPDDFAEQHRDYMHFKFDRQAILRLSLALHWAWVSIVFVHTLHTGLAILFVVFLPVDHPTDWPPLFGNPMQAYSLRRFWGVFWHKIASPSQAMYGQVLSRRILEFKSGTAAEKAFIAFWVFAFSGVAHSFANLKAEPRLDPFIDLRFLLLNFIGGLAESLVIRAIPRSFKHRVPVAVRRLLGYAWVYFFFYCTVPSYQWAEYYNAALQREGESLD